MPGNLEALLILPEHASGVNKKLPGNPYDTRVSGPSEPSPAGVTETSTPRR